MSALPIKEQKVPLSVVKPLEPPKEASKTAMESDISDMVLKVVQTHEQKNVDMMAETHNKLIVALQESKLTLPHIILMLNMVLLETTQRALDLYINALPREEETAE